MSENTAPMTEERTPLFQVRFPSDMLTILEEGKVLSPKDAKSSEYFHIIQGHPATLKSVGLEKGAQIAKISFGRYSDNNGTIEVVKTDIHVLSVRPNIRFTKGQISITKVDFAQTYTFLNPLLDYMFDKLEKKAYEPRLLSPFVMGDDGIVVTIANPRERSPAFIKERGLKNIKQTIGKLAGLGYFEPYPLEVRWNGQSVRVWDGNPEDKRIGLPTKDLLPDFAQEPAETIPVEELKLNDVHPA